MSREKPPTQHLRVTLPADATTEILDQMFSRFPGFRRNSARLKRGQRTGDLLGYVDFDSVRDAEDAKHATDRRSIDGRPPLDVTFAPPLRNPGAAAGGRGPSPGRGGYRDERPAYGGAGAPPSNPYASLSFDNRGGAPSRYEPAPVGAGLYGGGGGRYDEPYRGRDRPRDDRRRDGGRDGRRDMPPAPREREARRDDGPPRRWRGTKGRISAPLPIPTEETLEAPSAVLFAANLPTDACEREISHIFRNFHGFKEVTMRFKSRDEKLYREDRPNRPVTFVHFESIEDATAALQARQGYVVDPSDPDNTSMALNYSSKFNPENKKQEGAADGAQEANGQAADGQQDTQVADIADDNDAEGGDVTDVQPENSNSHGSPTPVGDGEEQSVGPADTPADAADAAGGQDDTHNVLDYDEEEDA